jgi:anion transporter
VTADPALLVALGITVVTVGLWATSWLPEYLTALLFFTVAAILKVVPLEVTFSGFSSAAFWLVMSGYVLGASIRKVGLADRIARLLEPRLAASWTRMAGGVVLLTYGLAFVMPSNMGRIALLMPIVMALADRAGMPAGNKGRIGLALAVGFGTYELSASILPANVPNLVMAGAVEATFKDSLHYLPYLVLHAPVLGVLKGVVLFGFVHFLYASKPVALPKPEPQAPITRAERRLAVLLAVTLGLWLTDSLHGISPAWVGLAAACVCLLPRVGFLSGDDFARGVDLRPCIYVAGIIGLAALVSHAGVGSMLGRALMTALPLAPGHDATNFGSLVGVASVLEFVVTTNGVPALFVPLAKDLASASGLPLMTVLMTQVIGYSTPLLPYQAAPIVVAGALGGVPFRDSARMCLLLAVVTFLVLLPLDYGWFALLGYLPH